MAEHSERLGQPPAPNDSKPHPSSERTVPGGRRGTLRSIGAVHPSPEPKPRRSRRFAFTDPENHLATEKLEAFLDGPSARPAGRGRKQAPAPAAPAPAAPAPAAPPARTERLDRSVALDTRADWNAALRLEAARHERYARPVAVAVIDLVVQDQAGREPSRMAVDGLVKRLGEVLRLTTRETDRIARVGPTRFTVLLPESTSAESRRFAERARRVGEAALAGGSLRATLRIGIAAAVKGESLAEALASAEADLSR